MSDPIDPNEPVTDPNEPITDPDTPVTDPSEPTDPVTDPEEPPDSPEEPEEKPVPICSLCAFSRLASSQEEFDKLVNIYKPSERKPIRHFFCNHEEKEKEDLFICLNINNARRNFILDDYSFSPCKRVNFYGECRYFYKLETEETPDAPVTDPNDPVINPEEPVDPDTPVTDPSDPSEPTDPVIPSDPDPDTP